MHENIEPALFGDNLADRRFDGLSEDTSSSIGRKSTLLSCANFSTSAACGALRPAVSRIEA
jgi:hypothetical protein